MTDNNTFPEELEKKYLLIYIVSVRILGNKGFLRKCLFRGLLHRPLRIEDKLILA